MKALQKRFSQAYLALRAWSEKDVGGAMVLSAGQARTMNIAMLAIIATMVMSQVNPVSAFTTPAAGSLGYDFYDVMVNKVANGPIGFVGGLFTLVYGATRIFQGGWLLGIGCLLAGTAVVKAQVILNTLGAVVY